MNDGMIKCALCAYRGHTLARHVRDVHQMNPVDYMFEHGALLSPLGEETMKKLLPPRTKINVRMSELYPNWKHGFEDNEVATIFERPTSRTPKLDPNYSFPEIVALELSSVLDKPTRNNVWLSGPSGSGKTDLVKNLAAVHNANFFSVYAHQRWTPANAFGKWVVQAKAGGVSETVYQYGIVPKWLREGGWLLINEFSTLDPEMTNALKPILEFPRRIILTENDDEMIEAENPEDCKLIVTDNTMGRGDDSGMFVNTNVQSAADMRRFNAFLYLDYLPDTQEKEMLARLFPDLPKKAIEGFVAVANKTRNAFKNGECARPLSTAEVINWADHYQLFVTAHYSARISFLNSYDAKDATRTRELINNEFGQEDSETLQNAQAAARASDKIEV